MENDTQPQPQQQARRSTRQQSQKEKEMGKLDGLNGKRKNDDEDKGTTTKDAAAAAAEGVIKTKKMTKKELQQEREEHLKQEELQQEREEHLKQEELQLRYNQHQAAPLTPLCWATFCEKVVPYLQPTDMVATALVTKESYRLMRSDELWELWLVQIRGGGDQSLLEELKEAKTLEFFGKTYMDAYIAATACKCADCGTWTGHLNLLVLRPTCGPCFTQWSRTNLMVKSKLQYHLSSREFDAIPSVSHAELGFKGPFSTITLVVRAHAERLATERYPNGLVGFEADREARKQKARDGRAKVIADYEKRVAEAAKVGKKRPKYPKTSSILDSSVNEQDQGMAVDWFHGIVIPFFGYRRKNAPTRPISAELLTVTQYFACTRCSPNRDREVQYKIPTFPTHAAIIQHAFTAYS